MTRLNNNQPFINQPGEIIMIKSDQINELATSLSKAQAELSNPKKTSANPFFKSRYADLSEVINVSKLVLSEHGLSVMQLLSYSESLVHVETIMLHVSGQYISETLSLPVAKHDAQGIGSACTYARRYAWAAICGLAQEDDDANAASSVGVSHQAAKKNQARPYYPDDRFFQNKQAWYESIESGKRTKTQILDHLLKEWTLTGAQMEEIESWN